MMKMPNILTILESTYGSIRSVFRHKQRSFSLVAGMILGAGILGGIFIYTDIVNEANFNSIRGNVNYEVRFDLKAVPGPKDNYSLQSMMKDIKQNPLVDDAVILYGQSREKITQTATSTQITQTTLQASFPSLNGQTNTQTNPTSAIFGTQANLINESDVGSSQIISKIASSVYEGSLSFKNNGIVIPQTIADTHQLHVGSITNVTLYLSASSTGSFLPSTQYNLTNVLINGIYRTQTTGGSIFTNIFNQEKIYVGMDELQSKFPTLFNKMKTDLMGFIAVKVNSNKLTLSDSAKASTEIDQFMNQIEKKYQGEIIGTNEISTALLGSQIFSIFIVLFDLFLTFPVFILGVYLMTFGAQMSLDDRKKEIAIYKIQGASARQILKSVFGEIIVLIVIGSILGYGISVLVGLSNSLAIGYGKFDFGPNFDKLIQALSYVKINYTAFLLILILGGALLLLIGYHRSKSFIEAEIATTLFKTTEKDESFFFRYWLDYILFGLGILALLKALLNQYFAAGIDLGPIGVAFIDVPGPIEFWFGGALFISRLAKVIPSKIDKYILKLRYLSDVRVMIFADLRRRTANTSKIALIIALAISFSVLASVQGTTHEMTIDRQVTWETGADLQLKLTGSAYGSIVQPYIKQLGVSGISSVLPVGKLPGEILNDAVNVYYTNTSQYAKSPYFQSDSMTHGSVTDLKANPTVNAIAGNNVLFNEILNVGDTINLGITFLHYNGSQFVTSEVTTPIKIVGSMDHTPGGITSNDILVDYAFIQNLYNTTNQAEFNAYNGVTNTTVISNKLNMTITQSMLDAYYPADLFLIQTTQDANSVQSDLLDAFGAFSSNVYTSATYSSNLANAHDISSAGFGIAGLLTSMFFISLLSATIGVFIFISLIVRSRSKEFAILRAIGATERQIYKIALSEVISVLIFALIAGTVLGLGLAYMFNGFFEFMNQLSGSLSYQLPRLLVIPLDTIFYSMVITSIIIIIATILPTRRVANQEIIEETRQV